MGGYDEESQADFDSDVDSTESSRSEAGVSAGAAGARAPQVKKSTPSSGGGRALRPIAGNTPMEILAGGIAGASIGTAAAAMVLQPSNIVFVAGGLSW
jgi:hypothetical protein